MNEQFSYFHQVPPPQPMQIAPPQLQSLQPPVQYQQIPAAVSVPQSGLGDEIRSLWIGDLQYWMEESYIHSCFATTGEVLSLLA